MPTIPEDKLQAIHEALYHNRKIEAIKIYRACTGKSLVDAKRTIDDLDAELRLQSPQKFGEPAKGGGCQGVLVLLAGIVALALIWWFVSK